MGNGILECWIWYSIIIQCFHNTRYSALISKFFLDKENLYTIYFLVCSISIIHGALEENGSLA